jgi:sec-independent protein translocase protein TatB
MFDIGASELLLIVIVAVVVIGPKDLPLALRTAGKWMAKVRRVSSHFRSGLDTMIREAELEELEREWKQRNEAIMKAHPDAGDMQAVSGASAEAAIAPATHAEPQSPPPPP